MGVFVGVDAPDHLHLDVGSTEVVTCLRRGRGSYPAGFGCTEPVVITAGTDFTGVRDLLRRLPVGQETYRAAEVVAHLLGPEEEET